VHGTGVHELNVLPGLEVEAKPVVHKVLEQDVFLDLRSIGIGDSGFL
jgi:hypothetical protein